MQPAEIRGAKLALVGDTQREAFRCCVDNGSPAVITPYEMTVAVQARFQAVESGTVSFAVLDNLDYHFPSVFNYCVAFQHTGRTWLFLSRLREFIPDPSAPPLLVLWSPPHVVGVDIRRTVRFNVVPGTDLEVELRNGDQAVPATVLDIGVGGTQLEFNDVDPDAEPGDELHLQVYLGDTEVALRAKVRYRHGSRYGLAFNSSGEPPGAFAKIVSVLEQHWYAALGEKWLTS